MVNLEIQLHWDWTKIYRWLKFHANSCITFLRQAVHRQREWQTKPNWSHLPLGTLKPESKWPLYSTVIGTLAVDEWAVTFDTATMDLGGLRPRPVPCLLYQM